MKQWTFETLSYERPDLTAFRAEALQLVEDFKKAGSYKEQRALYEKNDALYGRLFTVTTIASIRHDENTADPFYAGERAFLDQSMPTLTPLRKAFLEAFVNSPFAGDFEKEFGSAFLESAKAEYSLADERLVPEMIGEAQGRTAYSKLSSSCKTQFKGKSCNFYGLLKFMESPDRALRKEALTEWASLYEKAADSLNGIYDSLIKTRVSMAQKLGMTYTEFAYRNRQRFDYGPADAARFRDAIRDYVVPLCHKVRVEQQKRLGVDTLYYYDESLFYPESNPEPRGDRDALVAAAGEMYRELSPETDEFFSFMRAHGLFDLDTRPGKRMGGYCTALADYKAPFIFSNFNGTSADVDVLTHEAGHAFQGYLAGRLLPLREQAHSTSEINEIHSMTMEHFAYPYLDKFFGEDAPRQRKAHLAFALLSIPYFAAVDEFQHGVYENPDMTAEERYSLWQKVERIYLPDRNYGDCPFLNKGGFWMQKQHIFLYPFYYIEYGLAQICAFDYYLRMLKEPQQAWADYLRLCRAGGSRGYFELLKIGALRNPFDENTVKDIMAELSEVL